MSKDQVPTGEILKTVTAADGAVIKAVHSATHRLDIECTDCGSPYTLLLSPGFTTVEQHIAAFAETAEKHARTRHNKPRAATAGGQKP